MSLEASTLNVVVQSSGVGQATEAMNKYALAADKAEKSTAKLSKSTKGVDTSAKQQEKVWYDLMQKSAKYYEQQFNAQQRHNNKLFGLVQAEANRMNRQMDSITKQDAANFAKRRAQEQKQLQDLDVMRRNASAKEYSRAQSDANKLNTLMDRQRKQQEAAAKASAERQRVLNASYSSASLAQQIATLQKAQAYSAQGGNASARYGSMAGSAASSGELTKLQQQYRQLQTDARRANATMADTHAAVRGLSGSLGALWLTYGNLLPLIAGAGIGMALKGIVAVGADIEHTLEKIRVLAQATTGEIDQMRGVIFELGKGVQGPQDVAKAFSVLTLAGLNAKEAMQGVGAALNLAVAGDVSIEKASTTLVQISTSLGYAAADFGHIADVIAKTAAVSMSSVDSISGAFLSAAAVGEVYGASLQDIGLGLATVANLGIQATAAGTTLKNFYADLSKGTAKSTGALKAMGLSLRDLKDENGGFIDLVDLVYKLEAGFSKLNPQARAAAMDKLFGERGIKTGAALIAQVNQLSTEMDAFGNTYKNKLEEVADQINKAAAFSTLAAIAMAQTTTNQLKSVGNTLKSVLGQAFESIAPQIGVVARELKKAFNSPEFSSGLLTIAKGVADLTVALVKNFDVIVKLAVAYAAFKFTMFAAGLVSIAQGFTLAAVGARAFAVSLGPIGVAIAGLTALWAIYKANKNDALNNTAGAQNLGEFADNTVRNAEAAKAALELRKSGASDLDIARKAQMEADKSAAAGAIKISQQGLNDMKKQMDNEYSTLSTYQKKRIELVKSGQAQFTGDGTAQKFIEKQKSYDQALAAHANQVKVVTSATDSLIKSRQEDGKLADAAAKRGQIKPTGDGELGGGDGEKTAKKALNFIQNEALELNKLRAGYDAKNAAMRQSIELGKHVAAEAQQAIVMENLLAGKYGSKSEDNALYQSQMRLAMLADEAKAENERLKKVNEFANKLAELESAQKAYNAESVNGGTTRFGALRKEAEGLIQVTSMSEKAADALRGRADAMDAYKQQQEAVAKLENAAASAKSRAGSADEEVETMLAYGVASKASAMQLAELYIQKQRLSGSGSDAAVALLREASATEQLSDAYRDLVKEQLELDSDLEKAQAESFTLFGQNEMEKVRIVAEAQKKMAALKLNNAQTAFDEKAFAGTSTAEDVVKINAAQKAYEKTLKTIDKISAVKMDNLLAKEEVDRWKDLADVIGNSLSAAFGKAGEAAGTMFSLFAQGQARELMVTREISGLKEAQAKDGIDRTKEINNIQHQSAVARIGEYAGMASAAQGFFEEGSRGYAAMGAAAKVLHTAEVALSLVKGVNAVLSQGAGDPYSAFARMAAMAAIVVGLGVALSGGVGGGGGMSMQDRQESQGTGSVLGSSTVIRNNKVELVGAKSESIANSLSILERDSGLGLVQDKSMLDAMRNLSNSISKLATIVVRDSDLSGATIPDDKGSAFALGSKLDMLGGDFLGKVTSKVLGAVFGGKVTNEDIGFSLNKGNLAETLSGGVKAFQYSDMKKDGGLFRSDKSWTDSTSVGAASNKQFTMIFESMAKTLTSAAEIFGMGGDAFTSKLNSFIIDIGKISLKGMTGEEIEKELQSVFSKVGDDMAMFAFGNLSEYQKIGEGFLETISRVANEFLQVTDVFTVLGKTIPKGMEGISISQKMVEQFGGIEELTSGVSDYMQNILSDQQRLDIVTKSVTEAMSKLNLASVDTKEEFKALVDGLDLTKQADMELFKSLMDLAPSFAQVVESADNAAKAAEELAEKERELMSNRLTLEGRIAELTKNSAEASRVLAAQRAMELAEMDSSLQPLQTRVWMLEDEAVASDKAKEAAEMLAALTSDRLSLEGQLAELTNNSTEAARVLAAQRVIELAAMDESLRPLQSLVWLYEDQAIVTEKAKSLLSDRLGLEATIAELTGDTHEATRVLAAQRTLELAAMDESLKTLQQRAWMLEDEAKIMEKLRTKASDSIGVLSAAIDKEKGNIDKEYEAVIASVNKAAEASVKAAEMQKEAAEKQRDVIKGVLGDIDSALKTTQVESFDLTKARRAEAQSYLAVSAIQARSGGSVGNMAGLSNALEAISKPSEDLFGSFEEYARDQAMANFNLASLQGAATKELSLAELTIERLSGTIDAIQSAAKSQIEAIEKTRDAEKESLDSMLINAQEQLDALNGINTSVLSVVEALNSFYASMAAARATEIQQKTGNNGMAIDSLYKDVLGRGADSAGKDYWTGLANSGTSIDKITSGLKDSSEYKDKALKDLYKNVLGRPADAAGLAYWKERLAGGISFSSIEDTFRNSAEYYANKGIASYDVGTDFVPKDGIAMIHKGEMITPATDASAIRRQLAEGSNSGADDMRAELREIKQAIMTGDIAVVQKLAEILRIEKKWDQEGQPEIRNVELDDALTV